MPAGLLQALRESVIRENYLKFLVAGSVFGDVSLRNEIGP